MEKLREYVVLGETGPGAWEEIIISMLAHTCTTKHALTASWERWRSPVRPKGEWESGRDNILSEGKVCGRGYEIWLEW